MADRYILETTPHVLFVAEKVLHEFNGHQVFTTGAHFFIKLKNPKSAGRVPGEKQFTESKVCAHYPFLTSATIVAEVRKGIP